MPSRSPWSPACSASARWPAAIPPSPHVRGAGRSLTKRSWCRVRSVTARVCARCAGAPSVCRSTRTSCCGIWRKRRPRANPQHASDGVSGSLTGRVQCGRLQSGWVQRGRVHPPHPWLPDTVHPPTRATDISSLQGPTNHRPAAAWAEWRVCGVCHVCVLPRPTIAHIAIAMPRVPSFRINNLQVYRCGMCSAVMSCRERTHEHDNC